jgi:murein L,D-transpeptidase YcbB/YkuD
VSRPFRKASGRPPGHLAGAIRGTLLIAVACAFVAASARAVEPPGNPGLLIPTSLQPPTTPAAPLSAPGSAIQARIENSGLEISGERLHAVLLRRFYAARGYEPVWTSRQTQAAALLNTVFMAGDHGLDPDLFHADLLRNAAALPQLDRELLLSDAFLGFADALVRGALPIEERMDDEDLTPEPVDVAAVLDSAINSPDPAATVEALAPHSPGYAALQRGLRAYRAAADKNGDARLRQIEVNLERLRWLTRNLPPDRVWVNLASAQLVLYRGDQPAFTTRVVIGQTDKQTPEFHTTIDSVLFNPPWNVPRSIATTEILPKLNRDPDYLTRHHMTVRSNGAIQQLAGPYSALGRLKFEMNDRFDVYLHDTPEKALFVRDNRRQSHGCVRVQNPRELAALLLQQPVEVIDKGIAQGSTNRRMLPTPMPVFLVYQTAFADADGTIQFRPDVYDRDNEIWQHLHPSRQAPVAQHDPPAQPRG